ncbi:GNAT family N-acetyltransferase [Actinoplanes auranticolor]|uniref:GNAT family acetyltransferase n=1 Tax=Actinoplanes auranticolor TaxID=47988 RepID=A0A919S3X7_9ACTN|nr:GNAT family N-acetyltransferase [Actinoplanes auranticolor]GIM64309.1 GNAT family acetyltransferase [Actinoplanes auranticolor]
MPQPILRTERLVLVPLADRHLEQEVELDADPEVLRYIFGRARSREEVVAAHAERMALGRKVDGLGYWMAYRSPGEDDFVGLMMLPPAHGPDQPDDPAVAELGYRLLRRHWRQGLASEASRALLRHAFETVGQTRVIAQTMAVNTGSRGVMAAVGLRYVRTYFPVWDDPLPGADLGEVEYEMTRPMWARRNTDSG